MALRKEIFEKYGFYRTDLGPGPNPDIPRVNDDTELGRRVMAAGERLRYEPLAVVYHPVLLERVNRKFFLAWFFDFGRAEARELANRPAVWGIQRNHLSILRALIELLPRGTARWLFSFNQQMRFQHKCQVWRTAGRVTETYRISVIARKGERLAGKEIEARSAAENSPNGVLPTTRLP
jgi:hypothetical protein